MGEGVYSSEMGPEDEGFEEKNKVKASSHHDVSISGHLSKILITAQADRQKQKNRHLLEQQEKIEAEKALDNSRYRSLNLRKMRSTLKDLDLDVSGGSIASLGEHQLVEKRRRDSGNDFNIA